MRVNNAISDSQEQGLHVEELLEKRKHERPWKLKQGEAIRSAVQGAGKWFRLQVAHCGALEGGGISN